MIQALRQHERTIPVYVGAVTVAFVVVRVLWG